jgi:hypothetical protein
MKRLAEEALAILDVAVNGLRAGHRISDLTILTGACGVLRVIAGSDWPLSSLQREYGASGAYRVSTDCRGIRVEGLDLCRRVEFRREITAGTGWQSEQVLPPARWEPLRLTASPALLTAAALA